MLKRGVVAGRPATSMSCRRLLIVSVCILAMLFMVLATVHSFASADECDKCGPTRLIGCRSGRCYYKCIRRCLGKDNKFYYEALKFNYAGQ